MFITPFLLSFACTGAKDSSANESAQTESQPQESQPQESQPQESQPQESQPQESQPQESQPADCTQSPSVVDFGASCTPESCVWFVETDYRTGPIEIHMVQTGDPAGTCGPGKGNVNECGEWQETHTDFVFAQSVGECGEIKEQTLEVVGVWTDQIDSQTTLFDTTTELSQLTVMVTLYDTNGNYADCSVKGQDPGYFASECN